jgi:hypothetical protein
VDRGWLLRFALQWRQSQGCTSWSACMKMCSCQWPCLESMCWCLQPFGETVEQVFARLSAMRDRFDGPPVRCQCQLPTLLPVSRLLQRVGILLYVSFLQLGHECQLKPSLFVYRS